LVRTTIVPGMNVSFMATVSACASAARGVSASEPTAVARIAATKIFLRIVEVLTA